MNLKAITQKIASWFKSEAKTVETRVVVDAHDIEKIIADAISRVEPTEEVIMSTVTAAAAVPAADTNKAVAIALALKLIDPALTVEQVQAATSAALGAIAAQPATA